ncbi:4-phosphopantetheinyl transferase [Frateuria sp. Soil773]|uniref:4'-phosphopantetheinyl transferase family protein n=1 Tax=Frateuria sp. Soil773 TaxID=1736407 RepID=UPI0006F54AC0|nr:4'-phosphopantetheinyl transferase superfamily protein [Frateuria sp. Soil773]KRF01169.1 4-phosphopantetheinyl transferase [Frateuria sp. Soil773]
MTATQGHVPAKVAERLRDDEVHVWQLPYDHRQGRAPLRAMLAAYLGLPAGAVALRENAYGRPSLDDAQARSLGFNWSHSGDRALIALARGLAPGIDLERLRERPRALAIAQRYFDAAEAERLAALAPDLRSHAFLELWTAKEAVLKALGRGLAFGLHRLSIAGGDEPLQLRRLDGEDAAGWQLQRLHPDAEHVAAVAWRGEARPVRCWTLAAAD